MSMTPQPPSNTPRQNPDAHHPDSQAAAPGRTLSLSRLLSRAVVGARGQKLGQLSDVIVRLRGADYPLVTGLVADIGGRLVFVPAKTVT
ncbi:MAG TPA: PRC-barrel domain-containing protein, partial [Pseudonocardiaceae bacterium]|nr:PRC-barrel domain-containing protein [Pseudonocardiaceae bacterium]